MPFIDLGAVRREVASEDQGKKVQYLSFLLICCCQFAGLDLLKLGFHPVSIQQCQQCDSSEADLNDPNLLSHAVVLKHTGFKDKLN